MKVEQKYVKNSEFTTENFNENTDLFLIFFSSKFNEISEVVKKLKSNFPNALLSGCSTAGEIYNNEVLSYSCTITGIKFEHEDTRIEENIIELEETVDSFETGKELIKKFDHNGLKHILIFSDGIHVNGADLVEGINANLSSNVSVTGGLAGDESDFSKTFIVGRQEVKSKRVQAVGFYGKKLKFGYGSYGGWDTFGIERQVTKSEKNKLFMLDDEPALDLYRSYLGEKANELPGAGLLFPLSVRVNEIDKPVVRTILGINETEKSLVFAGNIPEGSYVRLMKANVDRLIQGAEKSTKISIEHMQQNSPQLAILISCVGRKMVMNQLVEEEVEAAREILGAKTQITGFYSYGEIAPFEKFLSCNLHNQTMTVTTIYESNA